MLTEASSACFFAGNPAEMLAAAEKAQVEALPVLSGRARFLAAMALGTARIFGGVAAAGTEVLHEAVNLAENSAEVRSPARPSRGMARL